MVTTCKRLSSGNEVYARFHTSDEEAVRGKKYPAGTVECRMKREPTPADKRDAKAWVESQIEATGILKKYPELAKKIKYVWLTEGGK